ADLERPVARLRPRRLDHHRHDVRLRDGLPFLDGQGLVCVRVIAAPLGYESLPRYRTHGFQHRRVVDPAAGDLRLHHAVALGLEVVHGAPAGEVAGETVEAGHR